MDRCILKLDNGLMDFCQKPLELQMKSLQVESKSLGGYCMMVMWTQFG